MGKKWKLNGPKKDKLSLLEVAELLGYESPDTVRRLADEGHLPPPRGRAGAQYYTGLDVAIILEMFGRWGPPQRPAKADEKPRRPAKTDENRQERESEE